MDIDVILLTYTKDDRIYNMTKQCVESIINSEKNHNFSIKLIETEKTGKYRYDYDEVETIVPKEEFNYNKFLNIGLKYCTNEWILISNNDTEYVDGWLSEMLKQFEKDNELLSMSPYCPIWNVHKNNFKEKKEVFYGHRTSYELTGWSILLNRKVIDIIGNFDEQFSFWYQDNDYSMNLQKHKIKHGLVKNSIVLHHLSKSHGLVDPKKQNEMTHGLSKNFNKKWRT